MAGDTVDESVSFPTLEWSRTPRFAGDFVRRARAGLRGVAAPTP